MICIEKLCKNDLCKNDLYKNDLCHFVWEKGRHEVENVAMSWQVTNVPDLAFLAFMQFLNEI